MGSDELQREVIPRSAGGEDPAASYFLFISTEADVREKLEFKWVTFLCYINI